MSPIQCIFGFDCFLPLRSYRISFDLITQSFGAFCTFSVVCAVECKWICRNSLIRRRQTKIKTKGNGINCKVHGGSLHFFQFTNIEAAWRQRSDVFLPCFLHSRCVNENLCANYSLCILVDVYPSRYTSFQLTVLLDCILMSRIKYERFGFVCLVHGKCDRLGFNIKILITYKIQNFGFV